MRHQMAGNRLGRNSSLRKVTMRDIAKATLIRQRICTTLAKAKEARKLIDRLITLGKKGSLAHRRRAFAILCDHQLVSDLFRKTAPRFSARKGGYTRIIPLSQRRGDNARLVYLELTEKDEAVISKARSAATSKAKKLDVAPLTQETGKGEGAQLPDIQKVPHKPDTALPSHKKEIIHLDKGKSPKQLMSGLRKMFQRKTVE